VVYILRTGVAWEDLPERFGKPNSVYRRFRRWSRRGIWDELFLDGIPTDALATVMVDSTACKAQRYASGARGGGAEDLGRSRGGLTTRIHALVDRLGRPLCFLLTPGQAADCRHALTLLEGLTVRAPDRRPWLRHRCHPRLVRGARRRGGDPIEAEPEGADPARPPRLQEPP
jgi:transposase